MTSPDAPAPDVPALAPCRLPHRALVAVTGADAASFLEGLVTARLPAAGEVRGAALLTPQGKILFTFLMSRSSDGFRLECDRGERDGLVARLGLYRLRAKVAFAPDEAPIVATSGPGLADTRCPGLGARLYGDTDAGADRQAWTARRLAFGILEGPEEILAGQDFPHDVALDATGAVAFDKGCFVGQEVVSRVKHRGTARRRPVLVTGPGLAAGDALACGEREIGTVRLAAGGRGIAVIRIDHAGGPVMAPGGPVALDLPPYAGWTLGGEGAADGA